jgi:hypothetical protein
MSSLGSLNTASPLVATAGRWGWFSKSFFIDYATIIIALILTAIFHFAMQPAHRSFNLTDPSISMPLRNDSVPDATAIVRSGYFVFQHSPLNVTVSDKKRRPSI